MLHKRKKSKNDTFENMRKIISFSGNLQYATQMSVHHLYFKGEIGNFDQAK